MEGNQVDGGGGEEGVSCTDILPYEMWECILDKVERVDDLYNCYTTCKVWEHILVKMQSTLLLHKVIPLLWKYMSYPELVKLRLVCSKWKEIFDSTFIPENWDWEAGFKCRIRWPELYSRVGGTRVRRWGDNRFLNDMASGSASNNPFLGSTLKYIFDGMNCMDDGGSQFATISTRFGTHVRNLVLFTSELGIDSAYLTCLFSNFSSLNRLKLILFSSEKEVKNAEVVTLAMVEGLRAVENGIKLDNLEELTILYEHPVILPLLTATLVSVSPRMSKVTLIWTSRNCFAGKPGGLITLLSAIGKRGVSSLALLGWREDKNLAEILPREPPWPLRIMTVRLRGVNAKRNKSSGSRLVKTFLRILSRFSGSLEELHVLSVEFSSRTSKSRQHRALMKEAAAAAAADGSSADESLSRSCICNKPYSSNIYSKFSKLPTFPEPGPGAENTFQKLKILGISHAFLHPALFPGLMKACPNLAELRIDDLDCEYRRGRSPSGSWERVGELVSPLWKEAPPSLRHIVVDNSGGGGGGGVGHERLPYSYSRNGLGEQVAGGSAAASGSGRQDGGIHDPELLALDDRSGADSGTTSNESDDDKKCVLS